MHLVRGNSSDAQTDVNQTQKTRGYCSDANTTANIETEGRLRNTLNISTQQQNRVTRGPLRASHLSVVSVKWGTVVRPEVGMFLAMFAHEGGTEPCQGTGRLSWSNTSQQPSTTQPLLAPLWDGEESEE